MRKMQLALAALMIGAAHGKLLENLFWPEFPPMPYDHEVYLGHEAQRDPDFWFPIPIKGEGWGHDFPGRLFTSRCPWRTEYKMFDIKDYRRKVQDYGLDTVVCLLELDAQEPRGLKPVPQESISRVDRGEFWRQRLAASNLLNPGRTYTSEAQWHWDILKADGAPESLVEHYATEGVKIHSMPIVDMKAPNMETMRETVRLILSRLAEGKTVLIHCAGGVGRTGTVLACVYKALGCSVDLVAPEFTNFKEDFTSIIRDIKSDYIEKPSQAQFVRSFDATGILKDVLGYWETKENPDWPEESSSESSSSDSSPSESSDSSSSSSSESGSSESEFDSFLNASQESQVQESRPGELFRPMPASPYYSEDYDAYDSYSYEPPSQSWNFGGY